MTPDPRPMSDERFPRTLRVRRKIDFDRLYASQAYAADDVLVIRVARNELDRPRLGLSVSRKVGNAVVRNRWKRRIREVFRRCRAELPPGIDIVVRPRRGAESDYAAIKAALARLVRRAAKNLERASGGGR